LAEEVEKSPEQKEKRKISEPEMIQGFQGRQKNKKLMESIASDDDEIEVARAEFEEELKLPNQ